MTSHFFSFRFFSWLFTLAILLALGQVPLLPVVQAEEPGVTPTPEALKVKVEASEPNVEVNEELTYKVKVSNPRDEVITDVQLKNALPAESEYVAEANSDFVYDAANDRLELNIPSLAPGEEIEATFKARPKDEMSEEVIINKIEAKSDDLDESIVAWDATPLGEKEADTGWITPDGGVFEAKSKPVMVVADVKAIEEPLKILLSSYQLEREEEERFFDAFELKAYNKEERLYERFEQSLTISIDVSQYRKEFSGKEGNPSLYWFNEEEGKWELLIGEMNWNIDVLSTESKRFGTFALGMANVGSYGAQYMPTIDGFAHDEWSGNSSISYPLTLPPAPGGMSFGLGLSYSSENANSQFGMHKEEFDEQLPVYRHQASNVGWGWNLSGLARITRDWGTHRFYLSYPGGQFELVPEPGGYEWQTVPQSFLKIRSNSNSSNSRSLWHVWTKDGTRYTFGGPTWNDKSTAYYVEPPSPSDCGTDELLLREAHVSEIRDPLGNRITVEYEREMDDWKAGASCTLVYDYVTDIHPIKIKYIPAEQSLDTVLINLGYVQDRQDRHIEHFNSDYVQSLWSNSRLESIEVNLRKNAGSGADAYQWSRRYELEQEFDPSGDANKKIMRLIGVQDIGNPAFKECNPNQELCSEDPPAWQFGYTYLNSSWKNTTVLDWSDNGQGGRVEYHYANSGDFQIVPCEDENGEHGVTSRYYVDWMKISDGLGNDKYIEYQPDSPWAYAENWDFNCSHKFEFGGYANVTRTVKRGDVVEQKAETHYHQTVNHEDDETPSHLAGLSYLQKTLSPSNQELQGITTEWLVQNNEVDTYGVDWVYKSKETSWHGEVSKTTSYSYDKSQQGNKQYGNVTGVHEYMNESGSGTPYRSLETDYYPRNDGTTADNIRYLTSLPARSRLLAGNGTCQGETRLSYDLQSSYTSSPTQGLLTLTQVAQDSCGESDENWSETSYTYDNWGNQLSVTDARNNTTSMSYDTSGNWPSLYAYPLSVTTPAPTGGSALISTYTWQKYIGQVRQVTDPNGVETRYQYDQWGRLWKEWGQGNGGASTSLYFYFNYANAQTPFRVAVAKRSTVGDETPTNDEDPGVYRYLGQHTFYDGLGREIQIRSTHINESGQDKHAVTLTTYNALNQPLTSYAPVEDSVSTTYRSPTWSGWNGQPKTEFSYDDLGRVTTVIEPDNTRTEHRYGQREDNGQFLAWHDSLDGNRHRKHERFDSLGRLVEAIEIEGNCGEYWGYNCDTEPYTTAWNVYATTRYSYDVKDQLIAITDNEGNQSEITYDLAGRKISMDDPDMGTWNYEYDAVGNLIRQEDARHQHICFYYDALNRLTGKQYRADDDCNSGLKNVTYTYDAFNPNGGQYGKGRRTGMIDDSGETTWLLDERGRVTTELKEIDGHQFATAWQYDALDRVRSMTYPADDDYNLGEVVTYDYSDAHYRDAQLRSAESSLGPDYVSEMSYNIYGQLRSMQYGTSTPVTQEYQYYDLDEAGQGRIERIIARFNGLSTRQNLGYTYDKIGNVMSITDYLAGSQIQEFEYDHLNRLTSADTSGGGPGPYDLEYEYDKLGNLIQKGVHNLTYGEQSSNCPSTALDKPHAAVTFGSSHQLCYDLNGNLQRKIESNGSGNVTNYSYDAENRLTQVQKDGQQLASYSYDGDGKRVKVVAGNITTIYVGNYFEMEIDNTPPTPTPSPTATATRTPRPTMVPPSPTVEGCMPMGPDGPPDPDVTPVSCPPTQIPWPTSTHTPSPIPSATPTLGPPNPCPNCGAPETIAINTTIRIYYYAANKRIAMREGNDVYYILSDHLGSTSITLNSAGNQHSSLGYLPFGENRFSSGTTPTQRRFTGQIEDSGTGLYFYNARYYDPMLGRFIQADTIVPEPSNPQAFNRYSYVYNNPIRYTDPTGHCAGYPTSGHDEKCWNIAKNIADKVGNSLGFVDRWNIDALAGLNAWIGIGIRFEGPWSEAGLRIVLEGLGHIFNAVGDLETMMILLGISDGSTLTFAIIPSMNSIHGFWIKDNKVGFSQEPTLTEFLHEVGHVVDYHLARNRGYDRQEMWSTTGLLGTGWYSPHSGLEPFPNNLAKHAPHSRANIVEDFADTFAAWVMLHPKNSLPLPQAWQIPSQQRLDSLTVAIQNTR